MAEQHGTPQGYRNHREAGERACGACKAAWRRYGYAKTRERAMMKRKGGA